MNILNINSYFLSSSVHATLQNGISENENINIETFVPISENYEIRPECTNSYDENIKIKKCFNKLDRVFFKHKNKKVYNSLCNSYELEHFDLVHAHSLFTNGLVARKINLQYGIPYIVTVRDTDVNIFFKSMPHLKKLGIDIMVNAQKIVFLSNPYYKEVQDKYVPQKHNKIIQEKSIVIANPLDNFWFENIYNKKHNLGDSVKLLYVGNIEKRKNLVNVARAVKHLNNIGYDIHFTILGTSKDKKIENKIKKYSFVKYIPRVDKEKLLSIYRQNDIFIMASIRESFGLVYGEAMTQGLPVIYTKNQGFDGNFIDGEVGYAVECGCVRSIEQGIINTILNYEKISKDVSNKSYNFKIEKIVNEYYKILDYDEQK